MTFSKLGIDIHTNQPVYLPRKARTQGLYVIGMQRMGKSGLFEELILQDIKQGIGVCVLDPHRELIDHVIARLPANREKDVISLDITDMLSFFGLPLLDSANLQDELSIEKTRSQFLHVFEKAFGITDANPVMYTLLSNIAYALIYNPGYTIIDIRFLLTNRTFREGLLQKVTNSRVLDFWHTHYDQLPPQRQDEESFYILNKLNDFENAPFRYIIGQSRSTIDLQKIMDEGKILLVKLHRQLEQATKLIGSILVALILNASDTRTTTKLFNLYADEFQNFATEDFAVLLEQAGKRNIGISMAHQNRSQLELSEKQADKQLKDRTLSVGSLVVFRVPIDAEYLAGQFDHSPLPGEPRLENITEPVFDEWDEDVWDSEEAKSEYFSIPEKIANMKCQGDALAQAINFWSLKAWDYNLHPPSRNLQWRSQAHLDIFRKAYSMTPEQYAIYQKNTSFYGDVLYPPPVFSLLPCLTSIEGLRDLLKDVYYYPVEDYSDNVHFEEIKNTEDLLAKLEDRIPNSDNLVITWGWHLARDNHIFYYPLRNPRQRIYRFPSYLLSPLEISLQEGNELAKTLLKELQEVLIPAKQQAVYIYNSAIEYISDPCPNMPESWNKSLAKHEYWWNNKNSPYQKWRKRENERLNRRKAIPIEKIKGKWYERWDIDNYEVFLPVLEWIYQRLLFYSQEIDRLMGRKIDLWHEHHRIVHHKDYLHERPLYDEIGIGSKYRDYDRAIPRQQRVPTEIPSSEVLNRVGNELLQLEKFTAWVKIGEPFSDNPGKKCLSCGLPNMYGALKCSRCGTKLPVSSEYTITTIEPEKVLYGKALEERIARIQANNRTPARPDSLPYCRSRQEVEEEITQRQTRFSSGSSPAIQLQIPQQQSSRRVARQVLVQGNCSNCGASNPLRSKFCNQCGEKL